jgi:peptidyl-dipeptidase A
MKSLIGITLACFLFFAGGCGGTSTTDDTDTKAGESAETASMEETGAEFGAQVDAFIDEYAEEYQRLIYDWNKAEWASNTHIVEGDTTNAARTKAAYEAWVSFVGNSENIERTRGYLEKRDGLSPLQIRVLEKMLYQAAEGPQTIPEIVKERIAAETEQVEKLYGFEFTIDGEPITPNEIDEALRSETDLEKRLAVWEASKEVGPVLKPGLARLRDLRNQTVQALGYSDFFDYQVSDYGMTTNEMLHLNQEMITEIWPLYREIHTWARHELAERYGESVPDMIPAHWLPNRWGQEWIALAESESMDLGDALGSHTAEWVCRQGEAFYMSLGFDPLPQTFWELSSLYPLPPDADYKKNTHASAWHMDLDDDVRSLMSVEPNPDWYSTAHHELGHIYYYMSYSTPEVPILLRAGANRAYHEAIGTMIGLAAMQPMFLANRGLLEEKGESDRMGQLLKEALDHVVFMPWGSGVMTEFEYLLYAEDLSPDDFNRTWWDMKKKYQGIVPPSPRGEEYADAMTKTHINNDPAQYYDYAVGAALLFQLHDHIAREILGQDPHNTDYHGSLEVGEFLREMLSPGASRPWQEVLRNTTGSDLDAQAMVDYFQPLHDWLVEQNKGREHTLPATL